MTFSIITPSYGQLDWLRLCVASVADQVGTQEYGKLKIEDGSLGADAPAAQGVHDGTQSPISNLQSPARSPLAIEHIIQDAGTPGIEEFAKGMGKELMSRYGGEHVEDLQTYELLHLRTASGYTLRVFKEPDAGMYDAVNKGFVKATGDLLAYINCDEQYLSGALYRVMDYFNTHTKTEILSAGCLVVDPDGELISARPGMVPWRLHLRLSHLPIFTASLFYRKSVVAERWHRFDTRFKDVADILWVLEKLSEKWVFKATDFDTSTFTDTGENMNLKPNARMEANFIKIRVKKSLTLLTIPIIVLHRVRKLFMGVYHRKNISYSIYTKDSLGIRKMQSTIGSSGVWKNRIKSDI
jgi:glycosyltransferase involved in cell wall biosynthesis